MPKRIPGYAWIATFALAAAGALLACTSPDAPPISEAGAGGALGDSGGDDSHPPSGRGTAGAAVELASSTPSEAPPSQPASDPIADAYAALEAADYKAVPKLIERLDAAFEQQPQQGRLAFYAGTMRMWLATGGPRQPGEELNDVLGAIEQLEQARALMPESPHPGAFLAIAQTALGDRLGDEARVDEGHRVFDETIALYPAYVSGVAAQAYGMLPRDHRYFSDALTATINTLKHCGVEDFEADMRTAIPYPTAADSPQGTCWNGGGVAHVREGILLIFGDIFIKNGDAGTGRHFYEAVKQTPTYDDWPFHAELEERIADADQRAALYDDDDRYNDPPTWMEGDNLCVGCHAKAR